MPFWRTGGTVASGVSGWPEPTDKVGRSTLARRDGTTEPQMPAETKTNGEDDAPTLPRPVQEHLGQKLRAAYYEAGDRPAYLGDPAIPPELDTHVRKLEQRDRIHVKGIEAVEEALGDILHPDAPAPDPVRRR
ncbi:hypothetical protein [Microvirga pudoricolor]|uniref:hypothetical protein n=1 Tax=Microvirga pudoricolor TaxID=2778729 RepID=UPI00194F2F34|nr:hypothetical protein [Microvirga pudoricolor]MBM6592911.1 hypothetical protein [Microvirga pudoricolor]